ncbi:MAG: xanthine dehydrogenase family protein subunit M [Bryobacteraceae bacterium]|nr:xanthine dehydrogenase family protein subunit M [Bryobacteraceae bacterium]
MLSQFAYRKAGSVQEAIELSSRPGARILAGGSDLLGCLRDGVFSADRIVSISGLKELKGVAATAGGGMRIGALATLAEIAGHPRLRQAYPALAQAAAAAASPQLRNQGTIGGNLCQRPRCWYFRGDFPCARKGGDTCYAIAGENQLHCIFGGEGCYMVHPSDTAPALLALDAKVRIQGRKGARTIPLASFFVLPSVDPRRENALAPGELLTEILLDPPEPGARGLYRKVRERGAFDFALVGAAIVLAISEGTVKKARVALSGVAPVPWRSEEAEAALAGKKLDQQAIAAAAAAAVKDAEPLSGNGYKIPLVRGMVEDALSALAG